MLRHIVMWKFRPGTEAERELFLTGLQGLYGEIPELKRCEVLRGIEGSDYDAALVADPRQEASAPVSTRPVSPLPGKSRFLANSSS